MSEKCLSGILVGIASVEPDVRRGEGQLFWCPEGPESKGQLQGSTESE